ncbi:MAG: helix-turn-helix transcriptional regulator [Spirochaetota bacterium]
MRTFKKQLAEQKKNPEFAKVYDEEKKIIELAVKIAAERNKQGITQAELAKKAHVTQQQLSKVENGANYTIKTFLRITAALRMHLL